MLALLGLVLLTHAAFGDEAGGIKLKPEARAEFRNKLGLKPYQPILTVKKTTKNTVEYDVETGAVVEMITLPGDDGEMALEINYWSVLDYLQRITEEKQDTLFHTLSGKYVTGEESMRLAGQSRGLMPEINLPDFMPKSLASIIGEGTGSLVIHGRSVTEVSGTTTFQKPEDQSLFRQQSKFPRLKLEQRQQINIEGTIGTKIHVFVDYNSQNQFENRNKIEVKYQGEEDEILQSLELGDVNLQLPPSMLVSANIPRGNFGIMGQTRLGSLTSTEMVTEATFSSAKNGRAFSKTTGSTTESESMVATNSPLAMAMPWLSERAFPQFSFRSMKVKRLSPAMAALTATEVLSVLPSLTMMNSAAG